MKNIKYIFIGFLFSFELWAQDPQFSMFYSVPMYLNPAFAGSRHANRVMLHNRLQWANQQGKFIQNFFSFDTYSTKYKSGIGASFMYDMEANNQVKNVWFNIAYAYELRINSNHTLRFGLQGGIIQKQLTIGTVPSQYNDDGLDPTRPDANVIPPKLQPDVTAGILYFVKRFYASLSVHHLNRPDFAYFPSSLDKGKLPMRFTATIGYKIPLILNTGSAGLHNGNPTMMSLTPTISYRKQLSNDQVDVGLYWAYKWIIAGAWYRGIPFKQFERVVTSGTAQIRENVQNNESVVFLIGASYQGFGFGYSYDLTVSTQSITTGGAHELHLSYVFRSKNGKKLIKSLPCPDFEYEILQRGSAGRVK